MSDYTPSEARVCIDFCNAATKRARPDGTFMSMEEADAAFSRWLAAHDAEAQASAAAEEPASRRVFSAAYRAGNGNILPIGSETVVQEHAQNTVDEFAREDDEGADYFVATRILPPWMPVDQEGGSDVADPGTSA